MIRNKKHIAIERTKKILKKIETEKPEMLFGKNLTISDINLLTKKLKQNPKLEEKIIKGLEEKRFNFNKYIEHLRKEQIITHKVILEEKLNKRETLKIINAFKRKGISEEKTQLIINYFIEINTKKETITTLNNILKIIEVIPNEKENFIKKLTIQNLKKSSQEISLKKIIDNAVLNLNNPKKVINIINLI